MSRKFALALSAAAVASAMASPAFAAIATGGNSNLFFAIWDTKGTVDTTDDTSYVRDLGLTMSQFATAPGSSAALIQTGQTAGVPSVVGAAVSFTFTPDSLFVNPSPSVNGWFESVSSLANLRWNVAAADTSGDQRLLTTAPDGTVPAISNFSFPDVTGQWLTFASQTNSLPASATSTHPTQTDGSNTATSADGPALASSLSWGPSFGGKAGWNSAGVVGQSLDFYLMDFNNFFDGTPADPNLPVLVTKFAYNPDMTWTLNANGTLVYATDPIPEPSTYALMAIGLVGIAGLARRREKK